MNSSQETNAQDLQASEHLAFLRRVSQQAQQLEETQLEEEENGISSSVDSTTYPPEIQHIRSNLIEASSQLLYVSEGEEPYEFVFIPNDQIASLPDKSSEFVSLIRQADFNIMTEDEKMTEHESQVQTFQEFFEPLTGTNMEDPYGQKEGYKELQKIVEASFRGKENVKVYKVGEYRRVGVYIVGLVKGVGIAGLKTLSIES
ncbi:12914_t:CDS:1 [Acaulospora morrowiae]|uniref:12914_t:CDS:1 n=1 Tax=Acaulospora morrowiae TaxID=94023 RepID=A0A9N8Z7D3_9GLOM|nr:12914_t:CDS:1 [Acaulospora morrowiae]